MTVLALLALHAVVGVVLLAVGDRWGRSSFLVAAVAPLASVATMVVSAPGVLDGEPVTESVSWVAGLDLALDVRLDGFGLLMGLVVSGIGVLVCVYAVGYFSHPKAGTGRLAALLCLFAGAMLGLVLADHLLMLFVCWELTTVVSYLLIGNDDTNPRARAAALQAVLITGAGGLALLAGLVIVGEAAGTYRISELVADPPSGGAVTAGLVCILLGAFTKSAQVPFGSWLPGAMVAPTPISAYLHSATMVKAGVYLIARLAPAFAVTAPWRPLVVGVGLTTMVVGGLRALRQTDLKLLLAMGTLSQLGLLVALFGLGVASVTQAAVALLLAHAIFKAALFMVVGMVDHQIGTRDIRQLRGLGPGWGPILAVAVVSAASMAGLPPMLGFVAKEKALDALDGADVYVQASGWILAVVVLGSVVTFAYSARFVLGLLGRCADDTLEPAPRPAAVAPAAVFAGPALVLGVLSLAAGLAPVLVDRLVGAATESLVPGYDAKHLKLWAGVNAALALSGLVVVLGIALTWARRPVERFQQSVTHLPSSEQGYLAMLRGLGSLAARTTAVVQNGSLPIYAGVVLVTAAVVPGFVLLTEVDWPELPRLVEAPGQVPLVAIMVVGAVAAAIARRRFAAALLLGAVGYGMAGLFVVQGAPDLALTQFAIETLTIVLFVLVLRFLPEQWEDRTPRSLQLVRLVVAGVVGVFVFAFAIVADSVRTAPSVSEEMIARSAPDAKGNNVVNVILVDFRGLDTLGEIAVLVVAAIGAVSLARVARRVPARARDVDGAVGPALVAEDAP